MRTRTYLAPLLVLLIAAMATAPPAAAQGGESAAQRQPVVSFKYQYAAVTKSTATTFWSTGQSSRNFNSAIVRLVPTGSPTGCTVKFYTGPTAALATIIAEDANAAGRSCTSAVNYVVTNIDMFFNAEITTLSGGSSPTVTIYVTLTNTLPQRAGASIDPWISLSGGVGTLGAGVQQVGEASTLSAEVTNTTVTEVVAAPAAGSVYVRGMIVTKAVAATGAVTLTYGTGTNCGTGTTAWLVVAGATSNSLAPGYYPIGAYLPAAKALCLSTEAAGTGVRVLTN